MSGPPAASASDVSRLKCTELCRRQNCSSFNFGGNICEIHTSYICENIFVLQTRPGFRYYDVETGAMVTVGRL